MVSWKEHVAKSMKGKTFGGRAEANAFMKKLSQEWREKKGKGEVDYDDKGTGGKQVKEEMVGSGADEFQYMPKGVSGGGRRRKVLRVQDPDDSEDEQEINLKQGGRVRIYGGSTSLLLQKGLGDGVHLSVLPK